MRMVANRMKILTLACLGVFGGAIALPFPTLFSEPSSSRFQVGARPVAAAPIEQPQDARQWLDRGITQLNAGQLEAARQSLRQALKRYQQQQEIQGTLWSLERLAQAHALLGNYDRASRLYQKHLNLSQKAGNRQDEANALASLASLDRLVGNYARSLERYDTSLAIREKFLKGEGKAALQANIGNVYLLLGEYDTAVQNHQQSVKRSKQAGDRRAMANSLNSLGTIATSRQPPNYGRSLQSYERALRLAQELGDRILEARVLNNLGTVYHVQETFAPALDYYRQSLAIARELNISELEGAALNHIGLVYTFQGDRAQAIQFLEAGLAIAQRSGDRHQEATALGNLGYTLWKFGDNAAAEKKLRAALAVSESLRQGLTDTTKVSIVDTQLTHYNLLQQVLVARNRPEAALEIAERSRARAFADLLANRLAANFVSPAEASDVFKSAFRAIAPPTIKQMRRIARDRNATLVEYAIIRDPNFIAQGKGKGAESALYIWVVQPNGNVHFRTVDLTQLQFPEGKQTLESLVYNCRQAIGTRSRGLDIIAKAKDSKQQNQQQNRKQNQCYQRLYQILIQPIVNWLPSDPEQRLVFLPHDFLFLVPFTALQTSAGPYLIENHTLLTAPSIQVLDFAHKRRQKLSQRSGAIQTDDLLIVGNPTMPRIQFKPGEPKYPLPALPGAEQEAKTIAELLNTRAILRDDASETTIRQKLSSARLIHLATHGLLDNFQDGDIPGALALAPSTSDPEQANGDGLLTASEIMQLSLQADLVVLSACDTGRGDITGDGVIGLSRALIAAGTPSAIVSLWAVPDAPTAQLMTAFYQQLQQTPDKAQALRQAMLATLKQHPDPKDWAAFTLIGEAE